MIFKNKIFIAVLSVALIACIGTASAFYINKKNQSEIKKAVETDTIYNGISIGGEDVSGLTKEEAADRLQKVFESEVDKKTIRLEYNDKTWNISFKDLDAKYDIEAAVDSAYEIGRNGDYKERYAIIKDLEKNKKNIEINYSYDKEKIKKKIAEIEKEMYVEPKNSELKRENGAFSISDEKMGYDMDVDATSLNVERLVANKKDGKVEISVKEIKPEITKAENEKATTLIGSYYTTFTGNMSMGRNENLRVGCEKIDGTILLPGETFSMNDALGPQTYENGFRPGGVIVNGKIEDGIGGGVCQVTTTLYNSVIRAELDVVERKNHSISVGYVPLGMDAAIAGNYKDFKFKNSTEYPVYIEAYISENKLITNIYGFEEHEAGRTVEFEKVFITTIQKPAEKVTEDPTKPLGEREVTFKGKTGSKVSTYKKIFQNGELLSREWFSDSTYQATADEVTVGTKPIDESTVPASSNADEKKDKNEHVNSNDNSQDEADENYVPMGA